MQQVVRASTPGTGVSETAPVLRLPPQMVEGAATRLCWISLLCALTAMLSFLAHRYFQPEYRSVQDRPEVGLTLLFMVLSSAAMVAIKRYKLLPAITVVRIGLVFEVAIAFGIAFLETAVGVPTEGPVIGASMVAIWICVMGLLIPNVPVITLLTSLLAALMWPVAYFLNVQLNNYPLLSWRQLMLWMFPTFAMAFWSYFMARRLFTIEVTAQKARELGSYKLEYMIGRGGMGEVWRATHRMLARDAAIKVIRPELMVGLSGRQAEVTRKRFEREARVTASLQCPHSIYLFDFGTTEDGAFYYVMELLNGLSLQTLVEKFGPQPASRVVHILKQACESLEEAHRMSLIHRDIKPSNIFVCQVGIRRDFVKVLDFGLVKNISPDHTAQLTGDGSSAGTPAYMAPEIALGEEKVDGRVDIYSLGCVAYFLLTGQLVFNEANPTAMALAHVQKTPIPPSQRSELPVPESLDRVILSCLEKSPDKRPRSAQELSRMLSACTDVPVWTEEDATAWWKVYLPDGVAYPRPDADQAEETASSVVRV